MLLVLKDGLMHRKVFLLLPTCFSHFPIKLFKVLCELLVFRIDWKHKCIMYLKKSFYKPSFLLKNSNVFSCAMFLQCFRPEETVVDFDIECL